MTKSTAFLAVTAPFIVWGIGPAPAAAQAKPVGWSTSLNLGGVFTSGNTSTTNFAAEAKIDRNWLRTFFYLKGGGLRQDSEETTQFVLARRNTDFTRAPITTESTSVTNAENYFAEVGFERRLTERFLFHVGGGYQRNLFNGVERLLSARGGVGYVRTSADQEFKLSLLATYTDQTEKVPDPATKDQFAGVRLAVNYAIKFGRTKQNSFTTALAVDQNLEVGDDLRTTWDNALSAGLTGWLSLQLSTRLAFRNLPALQEIDVIDPITRQAYAKRTVPYEKLDNQVQVSLVISWSPRPPSASRPNP